MERCVASLRNDCIYNDGRYMYSPTSVLDKKYYYMMTNIVKKKKLNVTLNHNLVPASNFNIIKFNYPNQIKNNTDLRSCDICKLKFPLNIRAKQNLHYTNEDHSHNITDPNDDEETKHQKYINCFDICGECYESVDKTTIPNVFSVDSYFGIGYLTDWIVIFSFCRPADKTTVLCGLSRDTLTNSHGYILCNLNPNSEHYKKFALMHNSYRIDSNLKCYMLDCKTIEDVIKEYYKCGTEEQKRKAVNKHNELNHFTEYELNKETCKNLTNFQVMLLSLVPRDN